MRDLLRLAAAAAHYPLYGRARWTVLLAVVLAAINSDGTRLPWISSLQIVQKAHLQCGATLSALEAATVESDRVHYELLDIINSLGTYWATIALGVAPRR